MVRTKENQLKDFPGVNTPSEILSIFWLFYWRLRSGIHHPTSSPSLGVTKYSEWLVHYFFCFRSTCVKGKRPPGRASTTTTMKVRVQKHWRKHIKVTCCRFEKQVPLEPTEGCADTVFSLPITYRYFSLRYQPVPISIQYQHTTNDTVMASFVVRSVRKAASSDITQTENNTQQQSVVLQFYSYSICSCLLINGRSAGAEWDSFSISEILDEVRDNQISFFFGRY